MKKIIILLVIIFSFPLVSQAHRSGCHRWHSCPSDSGSYVCGDTGHTNGCPTYSAPVVKKIAPSVPVVKKSPVEINSGIEKIMNKFDTEMRAINNQIDSFDFLNHNLSYGDQNIYVIQLQEFLINLEYLQIPQGLSTGYYGQMTKLAVARLQSDAQITPITGSFGPITRAYLSVALYQ